MGVKSKKTVDVVEIKEQDDLDARVQSTILEADFKSLKVADLRQYLKRNGSDPNGKKQALIDRVLQFMQHKNSI